MRVSLIAIEWSLGAALACASACAFAAEPITIEQVHALDQQCEAARTAKLEPIRARKVDQCAARGKRSRDECATFFSTYGNNSSRVNGGVVRGQFYGLPQCVAARKALQRMNAQEANQ